MKSKPFHLFAAMIPLIFATLACGASGPASPSAPNLTISPITVGNDLTTIDLCAAIPVADIEAVMGRKLIGTPEPIDFDDSGTTSGCSYDAGKDSDGNSNFGYVALTPIETYENQPLYENTDVSGVGDEAYFNNGADARQLWVRIDDKVAFVVAFGDLPNEEGAKAIARLMITAIQ